jgi:hypothetical protein
MRAPLRAAGRRMSTAEAFGPPISPEEQSSNLNLLERELNDAMKCPAGRNQVYVRSLLTGSGTTKPRIALKCQLRKEIGMEPNIFYEDIKNVCCGDHQSCPAWQKQQEKFDLL